MSKELRKDQHYALSEQKKITHIKDAKELGGDYYCINCGCKMIKKCGNHNAWHFAHYSNAANCSYESYLHACAKIRLKEWFEKEEKIELYYNEQVICPKHKSCYWENAKYFCCDSTVTACKSYKEKSENIKQYFTKCEFESTIKCNNDNFRADLLCFDPNNKDKKHILFEIKVSHECSMEKKTSSAKIIEFTINNEDDINEIVSKHEIRESEKIKFYGIGKQCKMLNFTPKYKIAKFILYKSGLAFVKGNWDCQNYHDMNKSAIMELCLIVTDYDIKENNITSVNNGSLRVEHFFNIGLGVANKKGYLVKNCNICKHYKYDSAEDCKVCSMLNDKECNVKKCVNYTKDEYMCDKFYQEYKRLKDIGIKMKIIDRQNDVSD